MAELYTWPGILTTLLRSAGPQRLGVDVGDAPDHVGRGDAVAARRLPRRPARQGRDRRRDRRLPRRDPRGGAAAAGRPERARHRRHRRRPVRHGEHLDDGGRRGRGIRCSRRQARQQGGELGVGLVGRARGARHRPDAHARRRSPRRSSRAGITFAFASAFHPGFRHAGADARRARACRPSSTSSGRCATPRAPRRTPSAWRSSTACRSSPACSAPAARPRSCSAATTGSTS